MGLDVFRSAFPFTFFCTNIFLEKAEYCPLDALKLYIYLFFFMNVGVWIVYTHLD